jgi:hypothetical protein
VATCRPLRSQSIRSPRHDIAHDPPVCGSGGRERSPVHRVAGVRPCSPALPRRAIGRARLDAGLLRHEEVADAAARTPMRAVRRPVAPAPCHAASRSPVGFRVSGVASVAHAGHQTIGMDDPRKHDPIVRGRLLRPGEAEVSGGRTRAVVARPEREPQRGRFGRLLLSGREYLEVSRLTAAALEAHAARAVEHGHRASAVSSLLATSCLATSAERERRYLDRRLRRRSAPRHHRRLGRDESCRPRQTQLVLERAWAGCDPARDPLLAFLTVITLEAAAMVERAHGARALLAARPRTRPHDVDARARALRSLVVLANRRRSSSLPARRARPRCWVSARS